MSKLNYKKLHLLYQATSGLDFHNRCDGISSTLVIIKSHHGKVFGGYTKL